MFERSSLLALILLAVSLSAGATVGEGGPTTSVGGVGVSDGGHGLVCETGGPWKVQFLDSLEAVANTGHKPDLIDSENDPSFSGTFDDRFQAARLTLQKRAEDVLGKGHPFLAVTLARLGVAGFLVGNPLSPDIMAIQRNPILDYGNPDIVVSPSCYFVQLALNRVSSLDSRKSEIIVNPYYWNRLSEEDQIGLLIHESLHWWFRPESSTKPVRQAFIYLTAPKDFRERNKQSFLNLVNEKREQSFF